jgi:hypothetical protein
MNSWKIAVATVALLGAALSLPAQDDGFTPIFDGMTLNGWKLESTDQIIVKDGCLHVNKGTGWARTEKEYGDFILKMDFRFITPKCDSGVFVRTKPDTGGKNNWPTDGYQVQTMDIITGPACGKLFPMGKKPDLKSKSDLAKLAEVFKKTGEWNSYEIECVGEKLTVKINGALITEATGVKHPTGHIGVQGEGGILEFKNIKVKELKK